MPSSVDLAAASRTKTRNISNIPTIIEKEPKIVNILVIPDETFSANLTPSLFVSSTLNLVKSEDNFNMLAASFCKPDFSKIPKINSCVV